MFITELAVEEVKKEALKLLKSFGIKQRVKKLDIKQSDTRESIGLFKVRLEKLRKKKVKLQQCDQHVSVPAFLVDSCNYLKDRIETDGIFRRPGVVIRQRELKNILLNGGRLTADCEHNAVDVADLLKLFFRELPEPCIPYTFHDILQQCLVNGKKHREAIFITLLLLPADYLYTLAYLMQFLNEVAAHHECNRMDITNLAIIWTPNLMPFKTGHVNDKQVLKKRLRVIEILIEHSNCIGVIPDCLLEYLPSCQPSCSVSSHDELECSRHRGKKKKRRSASLTRMLNGIKKIVRRSDSMENTVTQLTPDQPVHIPCIMSTGKKRKASETDIPSSSTKKRKELVVDLLPEQTLLRGFSTSTHLTPRIIITEQKEGRKSYRSLSGTRLRLSHFGIGRKHIKKSQETSDSGLELTTTPTTLDITSDSEEYLCVSKSEYEEIKNRVSRIESRISSEFENIVGVSMSDLEMSPDSLHLGNIHTVQSAYNKTLESAERLNSPTSDDLARHFRRDLKIRGSSEKKVIRSPSARKIGSLRRRSKDNTPQIKRNLSLSLDGSSRHHLYSFNSSNHLEKPTVGLSNVTNILSPGQSGSWNYSKPFKSESFQYKKDTFSRDSDNEDFDLTSFGVLTRNKTRRASSNCELINLPNSVATYCKDINNSNPLTDSIEWKTAEVFLNEENNENKSLTGRPSVNKLRVQNAGMVMAKANLFNTMVYSNTNGPAKTLSICKTSSEKSREVKKRNSSKSSKERKSHKKDSQHGRNKYKQENNSKQATNSLVKTKLDISSSISENVCNISNKENCPKKKIRSNSVPKTPIHFYNKSIHNCIRENSSYSYSPQKQSTFSSPLREINRTLNPDRHYSRAPRRISGKFNITLRAPKYT